MLLEGTSALHKRLLSYDQQYPSIPVPLPTLMLQVQHSDGVQLDRAWVEYGDELHANNPYVQWNSTSFHVLAPAGDVPRALCLQHCPKPPHPLYQAAYRMIQDMGGSAPAHTLAQKLETERNDYPFPGHYTWLGVRLAELFGAQLSSGLIIL